MANRGALKISAILQILFGVLIAAIIGSLALPIYGAYRQRVANGEVLQYARAGYAVFIALQGLRSERGPTRVALAAPEPASQSFVAVNDKLHVTADGAMADVLRLCAQVDCAGAEPQTVSGLRAGYDAAVKQRAEVNAALMLPLAQRRANMSKTYNDIITDPIDRLEKMAVVLGEKARMTDAETAELMEIKQLGWLARDGVGLERTFLIEGVGTKKLTPAMLTKITDLRGRAEVSWSVVRELGARAGVPADLVAAIKGAQDNAVGLSGKVRANVVDALINGKPMPMTSEELNTVSGA